MRFGLFSNGFRPHRSAGASYDEDIAEIVLAEELGFRDVFVSEHHGESSHVDAVDTIPAPELLICKAAALTKRIRMGAAVKLIHLHHPLDVAIQAAVTSHLLGPGRFIFGYGTGFAAPLFCDERGLSFEDRQERLVESLDIILKCWSADRPFDLDGRFWKGKGLLALPKPADGPCLPMATATSYEPTLQLAAERGYTLLASYHEAPAAVRRRGDRYAAHAAAVGLSAPRRNLSVARAVYVADSRQEAIEDLRDAVTYEVSIQARRGFLTMLKTHHGLEVPNDARAIDHLVEAGIYIVGSPDDVTRQLTRFYADTGGFGTLLLAGGKDWATRERRHRALRMFMRDVAPRLKDLDRDLGEPKVDEMAEAG